MMKRQGILFRAGNVKQVSIFSVFCFLTIFRCILREKGAWLEYVIWGFSLLCFAFLLDRDYRLSQMEKKLATGFGALCFVQMIGVFVLGTGFALKNVIATFTISCLLISVSGSKCSINIYLFRLLYWTYIIVLFAGFSKGKVLDNTFSGCLVFISLLYLTVELNGFARRNKSKTIQAAVMGSASFLVTSYLIFHSAARTALLCFGAAFGFFLVIHKMNLDTKRMNKLFYIAVIALILMVTLYINVQEMSWYQKVNGLSQTYFGKNIDSSRAAIWRSAFEEGSLLKLFLGNGTGTLPRLERYKNSSFHNTYIQLIAQNGLVGLSILLYIFRVLWKQLSRFSRDIVIQFVLSCFLGILLYNCFETTLLQNKTFLGVLQWLLIGFGIIRTYSLERAQLRR